MKWLIIGTGWISEAFIEALKDQGQIVEGIFSRSETKGKSFAKKHNINESLHSFDQIKKEDFDSVYIATPNVFHYEQAEKIINLDLDLMIEKPLTHSYELTKKLFALAKERKVKIMEAYAHITNESHDISLEGEIKTNFEQLSSKIKNNTYKNASSFSKDMFGGVITDLGVYPISLCIRMLGNVKNVEIKEIQFKNKVPVKAQIEMKHENGQSDFSLSKINDGDNAVYLNGKKILEHVSGGNLEKRMNAEINVFLKNEELAKYREISLETARIVEIINIYQK